MGCGCGCGGGTPCGAPCPPGPRELTFCAPTPALIQNSLARLLIKPADALRNLQTLFGMRPYIVRFVRTQWSGGARGFGDESVVLVEPILPTPLLLSLDGLSRITNPIGTDEQGGLLLTEVSGCYTEDELVGRTHHGTAPIPVEQGFYYEVEFIRADGVQDERRRFSPASAPEYVADQFNWRIRLERARPDRTRQTGMPR